MATPASEPLGHSVGLWKTLQDRATEVGDVERKAWSPSKFTASPEKPGDISAVRFPGLSPMAKSLTRTRSIRTVGNIGMAELTQWYHAQPAGSKHTPEEWRACQEHLKNIATTRTSTSDRSREIAASNRIDGQAHLDIKQTQVKEAFQARTGDLKLYHTKLTDMLGQINTTIGGLQAQLEEMQKFMNSRFGWPGQVNRTCLQFRNERLGIENVADDVEHSLISEGEMLETVKEESFEVLETEAKESLDNMKAFGSLLAADIARKQMTINVDTTMEKMSLDDKGLKLHLPQIQRSPEDSIETSEWLDATEKLLMGATSAMEVSDDLRERMRASAKHSDMLVKQHEDEVNELFRVHLSELQNAHQLTAGLLEENKVSIVDTISEIQALKERLDE